jgi:hypothetical protein
MKGHLLLSLIFVCFPLFAKENKVYGSTTKEVASAIAAFQVNNELLYDLLPSYERSNESVINAGKEFAYPYCIHKAQKALKAFHFSQPEQINIPRRYLKESNIIDKYHLASKKKDGCHQGKLNFLNSQAFKGFYTNLRNDLPKITMDLYHNALLEKIQFTPEARFIQHKARVSTEFYACHAKQRKLHHESLTLSSNVYSLNVPEGYELVKEYDDNGILGTGFQAYILKDKNNPKDLKVVIAGTNGILDWMDNVKFGSRQFKSFKEDLLSGLDKHLADGGNVHISGHSLGGGLAQYFSYQLRENFSENFPNKSLENSGTGEIHTVTWNAFGAQKMAERIFGKPLNPEYKETSFDYATVHYTTNSDPVAELGGDHTFGHRRELLVDNVTISKVGNKLEKLNISEDDNLVSSTLKVAANGIRSIENGIRGVQRSISSHYLSTIEEAIKEDESLLGASAPIWVDQTSIQAPLKIGRGQLPNFIEI